MTPTLEELWRRITSAQLADVLDRHVAAGWRSIGLAAISGPCPRGKRHSAAAYLCRVDGPPGIVCECTRGRAPATVLDVLHRRVGLAAQGLLLDAAGMLPPGVQAPAPSAPLPLKRGAARAPFVIVRRRAAATSGDGPA